MFKVTAARFNTNLRMVGIWSKPSKEVIEEGTVTAFKRQLDRYIKRKALEGYDQTRANRLALIGHLGQI